MAQDITSMEQLGTILELTKDELEWKESPISVPLRITAHYAGLIDPHDPHDPLRRQVVPTSKENQALETESDDPLAEVPHSKGQRLIHRYNNRVAFLATDICPMYCRHCFRRRFTGNAGDWRRSPHTIQRPTGFHDSLFQKGKPTHDNEDMHALSGVAANAN